MLVLLSMSDPAIPIHRSAVRCDRMVTARARSVWGALALVLLSAAVLLPGLMAIPPVDRDESRFAQLKAASHKALATKGLAARIYAHLFSLANFSRLVDRAVAVEARRKAAARD
jgi:hypothetical protein